VAALGKLVAVRYLDGNLLKGCTSDFKPNCPQFHIRMEDESTRRLEVKALKAVFFIKTMEGNPDHQQRLEFEARNGSEKKIWIQFKDGECLTGWSSALGGRDGFYFTPTDPESNLERVFVFRGAIKRVLQGDAAEQAARDHVAAPPPSGGAGGGRVSGIG
jgi:hypothetical protein